MKNTFSLKLCIVAIAVACTATLNSCKKAATLDGATLENTISNNRITAEHGILKFASQQQFDELINEAKKRKDPQYIDSQLKSLIGDDKFKSFYGIYKTLDQLAATNQDLFNEAMKTYPQINSEDEILNDDYFSRLVNENKEIIVNGSLYKISKEGVLVLGSKDISSYITSTKGSKDVSTAESFVQTQKYKSLSSARFFTAQTLASNTHAKPITFSVGGGGQEGDQKEELQDDGGGGGGGSYPPPYSGGCAISYHDYSNSREYEYFPHNSKARLKVKFWANNWVIYKTIGIKVVVQKQTSGLFDWWGSFDNHDYAKANINYLVYRINKKDFFPPTTNTTTPSLGNIASSLLKSAVKIQITGDLDILAFDLRDLSEKGTLSWLLDKIPNQWSTGQNILSELINDQTGKLSDKLFAALDKELGPEFQGKKIQKAFYYTPTGTSEPLLVVQNREYATYGSGIIDETLVKEWQGFLVGLSSDPSGNNLGVSGIKALDVSDIEVLKVDLIGSGSLDGRCIGIGLRK